MVDAKFLIIVLFSNAHKDSSRVQEKIIHAKTLCVQFLSNKCVLHLEQCIFAANISAYTLKIFQDPGTETSINNAL